MYVIQMRNGRYVKKHGGMNDFVTDPEDATHFYTKEAAQAGRPGHHRDMGGNGFQGTVITLHTARSIAHHGGPISRVLS